MPIFRVKSVKIYTDGVGRVGDNYLVCMGSGYDCGIYLCINCLGRGFGLRSAHAYILVYDVTSPKVKHIDILIFTFKLKV